MNKTVAVITRTKNRTILLERAIKSVLSQTYPYWIHVVVNDGGDSSEVDKILNGYMANYSKRLIVIHNENSIGMEAASNIGISSSQSDFLIIHDDDDTWAPTFLDEMIRYLETPSNQMFEGVVCWSTIINEEIHNNTVIEKNRYLFNSYLRSCISLSSMVKANQFPPISFLYKRSALEKIGLYDKTLPVLGDWEFNMRFLNNFEIGILEKSLCFYHHRLKISEGHLGNSVIAGENIHGKYNLVLRNRFIRSDEKKYANFRLLAISSYALEECTPKTTLLGIIKKLCPRWIKNLIKSFI
jgi:glycosyltransferase involved in cell wall biosynthesis